MTIQTLTKTAMETRKSDATTISLIGLAHGISHFNHLLLPPLFPFFIRDFGLSYSELGLLVTLFFVISGTGQALAGFLVDRVGARPVLFAALSMFVCASLAAATAQGYAGLMLAAALAGLGSAPFHPVDFTILNKRISPSRLGHAFSIHGLSGNIGWALAPLVLLTGTEWAGGNWHWAYAGTASTTALVLLLLVYRRDAIDDAHECVTTHAEKALSHKNEHPMAFLKLPTVWLCFSFFFWTTAALSGIQSFAGPALKQLYGLPESITGLVVTGYMLCGAVGMLIGGHLVTNIQRLERTIGLAMALSSVLLLLAASGWLPPLASAGVVALAGMGTGLAGPSRDMLIKRAAPPGATGRVYGTVYSGLDTGFAVAAPVFGAMMDKGLTSSVFYGSALLLLLGILSATIVSTKLTTPR